MIKKSILIVSVALFMTSCNTGEQKKEVVRTDTQRDSLLKLANEREESVNEFIATFNEIERNLDSVAAKQHIISASANKPGHELMIDRKNRINSQIASINGLMKQNAEKIEELRKRLRRSSGKNKQLEETIATLNNQLLQKNEELGSLNERLNALDLQVAQLKTSIDTLTTKNVSSEKAIAENTQALHTAYYVIGKTKDLQEARVIDRKGGLLGIGKTAKLSDNFDKNKFTRIDYTQTGSIPINSQGVRIITTHPADSYTLNKEGKRKEVVKNLVITNPEKFWSASKYLVIIRG